MADLRQHLLKEGPGRQHKLNIENRVLLFIIWLKTYANLTFLGYVFDISNSTVSREIMYILPLFWEYTHRVVQWPTVDQWRQLRNTLEYFEDCVGFIDGTVHEIERPQDDLEQRNFYDGHHHYHTMSTQVIVDVNKNIRYIHSGFPGRMNDAGQFLALPSIGFTPADALQFPPECYLLAEKGYANRYPIVTPLRVNQLQAMANQERQAAKLFNTEVNASRVYIEHVMRHIKTYRAVGMIFRHERQYMTMVVDICTFLAQRNIELVNALH